MTIQELKFSKTLYTKEEVEEQQSKLLNPDEWVISEIERFFILTYHPKV